MEFINGEKLDYAEQKRISEIVFEKMQKISKSEKVVTNIIELDNGKHVLMSSYTANALGYATITPDKIFSVIKCYTVKKIEKNGKMQNKEHLIGEAQMLIDAGNEAYLDFIYLQENYQGKGIGSKMLQTIEMMATYYNCKTFNLDSMINMKKNKLDINKEFYIKNGFIQVKRRKKKSFVPMQKTVKKKHLMILPKNIKLENVK